MDIEYDRLVDVYDLWSTADPAATLTKDFYVEFCSDEEGGIVELGVGNGRIAIEIAKRGKHIIGIDISERMLTKCRANAKSNGVEHLVHLIKSDICDFILPKPAQLVIMPFRTLGHFLTKKDKLIVFRQVFSQLALGGQFIFDHYVFDENWARNHNGVPRLMCKVHDESTGKTLFIWDTYLYDYDSQLMDCVVTVEVTETDGTIIKRQHHPLSFSWIDPDHVRDMVETAGFVVDALYGGWKKEPFDNESNEQIWIVKRPVTGES